MVPVRLIARLCGFVCSNIGTRQLQDDWNKEKIWKNTTQWNFCLLFCTICSKNKHVWTKYSTWSSIENRKPSLPTWPVCAQPERYLPVSPSLSISPSRQKNVCGCGKSLFHIWHVLPHCVVDFNPLYSFPRRVVVHSRSTIQWCCLFVTWKTPTTMYTNGNSSERTRLEWTWLEYLLVCSLVSGEPAQNLCLLK